MKIAVNTRMLLPGKLEGLGWFTHEVARRLVDRHPEWEFLFLFDRPFDPSFVFGENVTPLVVPPPARHPLLWYAWFEHALPGVFRKHRPDLFFSPDGHLSLRAKVPTAMVLHDIAWAHYPDFLPLMVRNYYRHFVPRYSRKAAALITVSEYSRQDISRSFRVPAERIAVCGNGPQPGFRPLSDTEKQDTRDRYSGGQEYFFYVGSLHPRKNIDRLIRAFDLFKKESGSPVKLLLAGAGGWRLGKVRQAEHESAFRDDILFWGYVEEGALRDLMGGAKALCYVSLFEGFGLPILEAMQADVPVICSNTSSMPEVAGEAGLLVNPENIKAMADAMEKVNNDADLRCRLIEAGKQQRARFSWDKAVEVIDGCLQHLSNSE